jgi:hypothetical protein
MSENVFANEWVECLEAHYMHVIRTKDKVTEPSLSIVMHSAGFTDKQLAELRVRATMHVDDAGEDFVPDLEVLDAHDHDHHEAVPETVQSHIYNIPIDITPVAVEMAPSGDVALSTETLHEVEAELEPEPLAQETFAEAMLLNVTLPEAELVSELIEEEFAEAELPSEIDSLPEIESELESEVSDEEDAVEQESEPEDPDAPQQLSLF